jgi:hypothetical protein
MQTDPEQTPIDHAIQDNTEYMPRSPKDGQSQGSTVDATDTRGGMTHDRPVNKLAVSEAAKLLRVTQSAERKRIQRGIIPWDKHDEGRIYVYVDPSEVGLGIQEDKPEDISTGQPQDELLEAYRDQIEFLRRELERKDTLLMSLMQRIPELESLPESRYSLETASATEETLGDTERTWEPIQRRSWLYRFFFAP